MHSAVRAFGRHWPLLVLLALAVAIRVLAVVAIYPGIWFSDGNSYVDTAATGQLSADRVTGYALVVAVFYRLGSAGALIVAQHVLGLVTVLTLYALSVRRGVPRALAVLGVVPVALDGYLVVVEHTIMSETVFHATLAGGLAVLLWRERPGAASALAAGLLFGYAAVVRSVGMPFALVVPVYLLVRRVGWRPVAAFGIGWLVLPLAYTTLNAVQHGSFGFTESSGRFLYARTAPFADCARLGAMPADERALCPNPARPMTTNWYLWGPRSPIRRLPRSADPRLRRFARRVILHQPRDYAKVVLGGVLHYFRPGHPIGANDYPVSVWQFPSDPRHWGYPGYRGPIRPGDPVRQRRHPQTEPSVHVARMAAGAPRLDVRASAFLHGYQRVVYGYGPMLAVCLLVVIASLVARRGAARLRLDAALIAALALVAVVESQALSVFSYRYGLIMSVLLPVAAAMAATALLGADGRSRFRTATSAPSTTPFGWRRNRVAARQDRTETYDAVLPSAAPPEAARDGADPRRRPSRRRTRSSS